MSLIFVFAVVWGLVIAVWLGLDWISDPNRGRFRPQADLRSRGAGSWRERRSLRVRREDAAVRSALRDRYGRSSLRLQWSEEHEKEAREADDAVITMSQTARGIPILEEADFPLAPVVELHEGDTEPDPDEPPGEELPTDEDDASDSELADGPEEELADDDHEPTPEEGPPAPLPAAGWKVGDDPLARTRRGTPPASTTVRSRVWKNLADERVWDDDNRDRLRSGKPPRRRNPLSGRFENAEVDTEEGTATWPDAPTDPFAEASDEHEEAERA